MRRAAPNRGLLGAALIASILLKKPGHLASGGAH